MIQSTKLAIVQSMDAMQEKQIEQLMSYVRTLLNQQTVSEDYSKFKKEAMKEIRQALKQEKKKRFRLAA